MIQIDSEFISIVGREPGRTEGWHFGGGFSFHEALLRKLVCFTVVRKGLFCRLFFGIRTLGDGKEVGGRNSPCDMTNYSVSHFDASYSQTKPSRHHLRRHSQSTRRSD